MNRAVQSKIEMSKLISSWLGLSYFTPKNLMRILILKVNVTALQQYRKSKYRFRSTLHLSFFLLFIVSLDNSFYSVEDTNNLINFKDHSARNNEKANMIFFSRCYATYTFYQANSFFFYCNNSHNYFLSYR